jgi:hypothetical protein
MRAFLKRRWYLLACAISLLAGTMINVAHWYVDSWAYHYGVSSGCLFYWSSDPWDLVDSAAPQKASSVRVELHRPQLHTFAYANSPRGSHLYVPLWFPLSLVISWIVFREVRWRKKRAKAADAPGTESK